jgi:hypothetical protein
MADVNVDFDAKDRGVGKTITGLQGRFKAFEGGINEFTGKVGALAGSFTRFLGPLAAIGAGFLGARSAAQAFGEAINLGGQLNDLASRTGASAGELMVLQRAFDNAGAGAEKVGPTINKLQRALIEAGQGAKTYSEAFALLNLKHEDLARMSPTEQLRAVAEAISRLPDATQRSAVAMQLLGKSGGELLPFLRNFNGEMETAQQQLGSAPALMDEMNQSLDAIGDNFQAIKTKAMEFALGALKNIAPALAEITDTISKIDFAAIGASFSDTMLRAYDFFRGLFADPSQIFSLYGDYLEATLKSAGDALITGFRTAFDFFVNAWQSMMTNDVFGAFAEVLADAFMYAVANLNLKLLEMVEGVLAFWGQLWGSVTEGGVSGFASKLYDMVKFFASDFMQAITNPVGFLAGKLTSALMQSAQDGAEAYQFSWDAATGGIIERAKAGLQGAVDETGARLRESGSRFGESLDTSLTEAVGKTDMVKSNFFGSNEAVRELTANISSVEEKGRQMREHSAAAALSQSEVPTYAESMLAAYEEAGLEATHLREEIAAAKGDAQITGDIYTGPAGIANTLNNTADRTAEAASNITTAYSGVAQSGQAVQQSMDLAGQSFTKAASDAGLMFGQEVRAALSGLTDSFRGFATEGTLQQAVAELRTLVQRLPQPVLV